jgi:hypothetical protein
VYTERNLQIRFEKLAKLKFFHNNKGDNYIYGEISLRE